MQNKFEEFKMEEVVTENEKKETETENENKTPEVTEPPKSKFRTFVSNVASGTKKVVGGTLDLAFGLPGYALREGVNLTAGNARIDAKLKAWIAHAALDRIDVKDMTKEEKKAFNDYENALTAYNDLKDKKNPTAEEQEIINLGMPGMKPTLFNKLRALGLLGLAFATITGSINLTRTFALAFSGFIARHKHVISAAFWLALTAGAAAAIATAIIAFAWPIGFAAIIGVGGAAFAALALAAQTTIFAGLAAAATFAFVTTAGFAVSLLVDVIKGIKHAIENSSSKGTDEEYKNENGENNPYNNEQLNDKKNGEEVNPEEKVDSNILNFDTIINKKVKDNSHTKIEENNDKISMSIK